MSKAVVWYGLVVAGGRKALLKICQHASYLLVAKREMYKVGQRTMQSRGGDNMCGPRPVTLQIQQMVDHILQGSQAAAFGGGRGLPFTVDTLFWCCTE